MGGLAGFDKGRSCCNTVPKKCVIQHRQSDQELKTTLPQLDELPDTSEWKNIPIWTLDEAALLWGAIDPFELSPPTIKTAKIAYERGEIHRAQWRKAALALRAFTEAVCAGDVSFVDAWEEHEDYNSGPYDVHVMPGSLPNVNFILTGKTRIRQAALIKWAQQTGMIAIRSELRKLQVALPPAVTVLPPPVVEKPLLAVPNYTTPALDLMNEHIHQHWVDFDPSKPETATPKKETQEWLRMNAKYRGLSQNEADAIDLITRPPSAKLGRRK